MARPIDSKVAAALEALSSAALNIEMPEDRKRQMAKFGGLFGRYSTQMMEAAEMSISAIADLGHTLDADRLEKVLMSSMSLSEKLAYRARKAINEDLDAFFGSSKNIKDLEAAKQKLQEMEKKFPEELAKIRKVENEERKKALEERLNAELDGQKRIVEKIQSRFTLEDVMTKRMGAAVAALREANTETEQDFARARMKGVIEGQRLVLQSREELLVRLESRYAKLKEKEGELTSEEEKRLVRLGAEIRFLREQNEISRGTIKKSEEIEGKTETGGYLKNLFARSFTGGLHGFLFEGKGPDEMLSQMGRDLFGAVTGKLGLSKTGAFGASSEEARLEKTQKAEAIMTAAAGRGALSTLNEDDMKKLEEYRRQEAEDLGLEDLVREGIEANKKLEAERLERLEGKEELVPTAEAERLERLEGKEELVPTTEAERLEGKEELVPTTEAERADVADSITTTAEDISTLTKEATTPGSLYTHDIHLEKIIKNIYDFLTKERIGTSDEESGEESGEESEAGILEKGMELLGGGEGEEVTPVAPTSSGGGGAFSGITNFLGAIADGVKKFGNRDVAKGALGMALVGASVIPFALGMKQLMEVPWENILLATGAIIALSYTAVAMGKMYGDVLKGALTMLAVTGAFAIFAASLTLITAVDPAVIWSAVGALVAISALALGIGILATGSGGIGAAAIAIGAGLLALIGASFIPFAYGLSLLKGIDPNLLTGIGMGLLALAPGLAIMAILSPLLILAGLGLAAVGLGMLPLAFSLSLIDTEKLMALSATMNGLASSAGNLFGAAAAIVALAAAVGVFSAAMAVGGVGEAAGGLVASGLNWATSKISGEEKKSVFDQIMAFASVSGDLMVAANALNMIASAIERLGTALASFSDSSSAMATIDKLINLDATQMKNLQDVSMAMEKVMSSNEKLKGEAESARMGQAVGAGANAAMMMNNNTNIGSSTMMLPQSGRMTDPSILFSSARYYSMVYR